MIEAMIEVGVGFAGVLPNLAVLSAALCVVVGSSVCALCGAMRMFS